MKKHLLFTYGTLRAAHRNSSLNGLTPDKLVETDVTLNDFAIFNLGWFPGIRPKTGCITKGDVWSVTDADLPRLDQYEGVPHLYTRETVQHPTLGEVLVYVYARQADVDPSIVIEDGDWLKQQERIRNAN